MAESLKQENHGPDQPGQKEKPYLQNNQRKKEVDGCMAQAVEHLPMHETLSSNPKTAKKRNKKDVIQMKGTPSSYMT
jgi:hypothetical protein